MSQPPLFPEKLPGHIIDLIALQPHHFSVLKDLARDKRIWEFYAYDASEEEKFEEVFHIAFKEKEQGNHFPYIIYHKGHDKVVGSTRFMDIQTKHRKLEIGTTWLHPDYWGTAVNADCKLQLLRYAFEELKWHRVQFKTDVRNIRSRKAIEKIGAQFEGVLRNDMFRDNNTRRDSAYFSIIEEEWPEKKIALENLYRRLTAE